MHRAMIRAASAALSLMLLMAALCGCTAEDSYPAALPISGSMPPEEPGEGEAGGEFDVRLYFISEDGRRFAVEERTLEYAPGASIPYAAVSALLSGPESPLLQPSVSGKLQLEAVEVSMGVCNVYLSRAFPTTENDWLIGRLAIAATLYDLSGIEAVNVFYNGKEQGYNSYPIGEARPISQTITAYIDDMEAAYGPKANTGEAGIYKSHTVTMYFANSEKTLLVAQSVPMTVSTGATATQMVEMLTEKLVAGINGEYDIEPVLPADFQLTQEPSIRVLGESDAPAEGDKPQGDGEDTVSLPLYAPKIIELTIAPPKMGYDEELMCAALTMTLTGYMPGISGVRIYIGEEDGTRTLIGGEENEYLTRGMYSAMLGTDITLDYPDESGLMLRRVSRIVPFEEEYDLYKRLCALLDGPSDPGLGFTEFSADDVESVYLSDGTAVVNWKAGFSQKLRDVIDAEDGTIPAQRRELLFIYSVINTLTETPFVKSVWMLEDGQKLGEIKDIYLGNPLLRSPGLMGSE